MVRLFIREADEISVNGSLILERRAQLWAMLTTQYRVSRFGVASETTAIVQPVSLGQTETGPIREVHHKKSSA